MGTQFVMEYILGSVLKTDRVSGFLEKLIYASQYLTKLLSEVRTLLIKRRSLLPCSATYTPILLSIGGVHQNYARAALPISDSYGIKPMRLYIRNYFCHPAFQQ